MPDTEEGIHLELKEKRLLLQEKDERLREARCKIQSMRQEWWSQQEHLGKLHNDYVKLQHTLGQHSVYCATLGATMGSMLWKVSRMDGAVENMLEGTRMADLITIMDNSLCAFLEVFCGDVPDPCANEYQFLLSWCGILTNVSACPDGRFYLSSKPEGRSLLNNMVNALPKFAMPNGELLKRMILMIIYNLVINSTGMEFMQANPKLLSVLAKFLARNMTHELRDLAVKLIFSLTQNIPSERYMEQIHDTVPLDLVEGMAQSEDSESASMAKRILSNLSRGARELKSKKIEAAMQAKEIAGDMCPLACPKPGKPRVPDWPPPATKVDKRDKKKDRKVSTRKLNDKCCKCKK